MAAKATPTLRYTKDNFFIKPGLFDELRSTLACLTCEEVVLLAEELRMCGQKLCTDNGQQVTVDDIECIEGRDTLCGDTRLYWFYAGPERKFDTGVGGDPFVTMKGTLLNWITDCVLLQLTYEGWDLMRRIRLPL